MISKLINLCILTILTGICFSQSGRDPIRSLDVLKYDLHIELSDANDTILVREHIHLKLLSDTVLSFDLVGRTEDGKGMLVYAVEVNGAQAVYEQTREQLFIKGTRLSVGEIVDVNLVMTGVPIDGLIIGKNKYGDRTFFGDNWPNRAHHWYACNDHPADKALFEFVVTAPEEYSVIANGIQVLTVPENEGFSTWTFQTKEPIPTKVAVIGVARFSISDFGPVNQVPSVSAYVYPQNEKEGFYDLSLAPEILNWFEKKIAPYPFEKLANVQSTTRYGGMENASCIFYDENAIDGKRSMESLIAHEIAHQWFGNSATESDFSHLWLSEGFATYLTNIYILETKGEEVFYRQMDKDRAKVIGFGKRIQLPVIDTLTYDLNQLLNANAYQKGSWFLHMLRMKLGDEVFWKSIRNYYSKFEYGNAVSTDFQAIVESNCTCEMDVFFNQWLYSSENPTLKIKVKGRKRNITVKVDQLQQDQFDLMLEIDFLLKGQTVQNEKLHLTDKSQVFKLTLADRIEKFTIDPKRKLLIDLR